MEYNKLITALKNIRNNMLNENITILELSNKDKELIKQSIIFDNTNMCFFSDDIFDSYNDYLDCAIRDIAYFCINYGLFYKDEFIGLFMAWHNSYERDRKRYAIGYIIKNEYRNCGIASFTLSKFIDIIMNYYDVNSICASVRIDNMFSRKLLEKYSFIQYRGHREDDFFIDKDNNRIKQLQFFLRKEDYLKK